MKGSMVDQQFPRVSLSIFENSVNRQSPSFISVFHLSQFRMATLHVAPADRHAHAPSTSQVLGSAPLGPFDLPEVLTIIGSFLTDGSLSACLRVSRTWYDVFISWFWIKVMLSSSYYKKQPSVETFREHASLIRILGINQVRANKYTHNLTFPRVDALTITISSYVSKKTKPQEDFQLFEKFPRLQKLEYDGRLLDNCELWFSQKNALWSHLTHLTFQDPMLNSLYDPSIRVEFLTNDSNIPEIQEGTVILGGHCSCKETMAQMWVIAQCPNLVHLRWTTFYRRARRLGDFRKLDWIARGARDNWPRLQSLSIPTQRIFAEGFRTLLESMTRLEELDLSSTRFNHECWMALQGTPRHLATLRILDLTKCDDLHGSHILDMLTSIPNLIVFKAGSLTRAHPVDFAQPWVCLGLRELSLVMEVDDPSSCAALLLRLSEMKRLERLEFLDESIIVSNASLQLTLLDGMGQLATLRKLEKLKGSSRSTASWGEEEAQWVLENWPKLTEIEHVTLESEARQMLSGLVV